MPLINIVNRKFKAALFTKVFMSITVTVTYSWCMPIENNLNNPIQHLFFIVLVRLYFTILQD